MFINEINEIDKKKNAIRMCKCCISTDSMITASLDVFKRSYKNEVLNS